MRFDRLFLIASLRPLLNVESMPVEGTSQSITRSLVDANTTSVWILLGLELIERFGLGVLEYFAS
jgi:hypothetical protein